MAISVPVTLPLVDTSQSQKVSRYTISLSRVGLITDLARRTVLLRELDVDMYLLEYDDERSGGFEPLRHLPKGHKTVTLGLISTKTGKLENKDEVIARIREAAKYAPLEQLSVGPQCGFASTVHGNDITPEVSAPIDGLKKFVAAC